MAVESLLSKPHPHSKTLKNPPPVLSLSCFSSRRAHLDSASYLALLRIYSLCLDEDPVDAPNPSLDSDSLEKGASFTVPRQDPHREFSNSKLLNSLDDDVEELETFDDDSIDMALLEDIMTDCAKLIGDQQDQDFVLGELEAKNQEKGAIFEKSGAVENQAENSKLDIETREKTQAGEIRSAVGSEELEEGEIPNGFENLNPPVNSVHEQGGLEDKNSEEGSVHVGFDNGDPSFSLRTSNIKFVNEHASSNSNCEGNRSFKAFDNGGCMESQTKRSCSDGVEVTYSRGPLENVATTEKDNPFESEGLDRVVKKRGPLNEERKAKKKIAKKRKRAKKEREQGVKRLKLLPITKPKEIKYCRYYLKGFCHKGDQCTYSHDTTLSKLQACTFFASRHCFKGDDCQFDHQLSKYPCHKYISKGSCSRGDSCMFSHEVLTRESSIPASIVSKPAPLLSSGKPNLVNKLNMTRSSPSTAGQPKSTISGSQCVMHKPSVGNLVNDSKKSTQNIPTGIHFLSVGNRPSDEDNKKKNYHQKSLPVSRGGKNEVSSELLSCAATSSHATKKSNCSNFIREPARIPSTSLQNKVSEASKILEEFLFCGGS